MPLPLYVDIAAIGLGILTAQAPLQSSDPSTTGSVSEEIVGDNCYVAREPVADENGQIRIHVEVLCD